MAELHPLKPSTDGALGSIIVEPQDAPTPIPITDQEVGEYREQDRYLPVRDVLSLPKLNSRPTNVLLSLCRSLMSQES